MAADVRRLTPELNSRTLSVRIGVLPIHFVIDKYQGRIALFTFFILNTKESILLF